MNDSQTAHTPQSDGAGRGASQPHDSLIGKVLGGCQILERVACGNMGAVYKGQHLSLRRPVAVKILPQSLIDKDPQHVERFKREAISAGQLDHPNIVTVYDVGYENPASDGSDNNESGNENGYYFIEMQFVEGKNVRDIIAENGAIAVDEAIGIIKQVASGLAAAHNYDIIHRDIKPSNIMLTSDGAAKIIDFGLAKRLQHAGELTSSDCVVGTPYYMAPEQWSGESCDHRTDIYGLGATFYYMVTGVRPYPGETPLALMVQHCQAELRSPKECNPRLPNIVCDIITKMMAKSPQDRHQTVEELIADLGKAVDRMATTIVDAPPLKSGASGPARARETMRQDSVKHAPSSTGPQAPGDASDSQTKRPDPLWRRVISRLLLPVGALTSACVVILTASTLIPGLAQKQDEGKPAIQTGDIQAGKLEIEKRRIALQERRFSFEKRERQKQNIDRLQDKLASVIARKQRSDKSRIRDPKSEIKAAVQTDPWTSRPLAITFMEFEHRDSEQRDAAMVEQLSARVKEFLQEGGRLAIVERQTTGLEDVLREQELSSSNLAEKPMAVRPGKVRAARLHAIGATAHTQAGLLITIKVVDVETTEEVVRVSNADAISAPIGRAAKSMADAILSAVKSQYPLRGRVTNVDDGNVTIDIGKAEGVVVGTRMKALVKGLSEDRAHATRRVPEIEITSVRESSSEGRVLDGREKVSVGMKVEEM